MIATLTRERTKIDRNLSGIRSMTRLPEALLVVDPHREHIAVKEARKLGIKVVALLDTDCDPDLDRPADPRQRRQHAVDRTGPEAAGRLDHRRQGVTAPTEPPPREREEQGDRRGEVAR